MLLGLSARAQHEIVGIRPGEKLHEQMIRSEDARTLMNTLSIIKILPAIHNWSQDRCALTEESLCTRLHYSSDNNSEWMSAERYPIGLLKTATKLERFEL